MTPESPQKPLKPRGRALPWTEQDLDATAAITPADVDTAAVAWRTDAPPQYRSLLDAIQAEQS